MRELLAYGVFAVGRTTGPWSEADDEGSSRRSLLTLQAGLAPTEPSKVELQLLWSSVYPTRCLSFGVSGLGTTSTDDDGKDAFLGELDHARLSDDLVRPLSR